MFKKIKIIINPASGQPVPILPHINKMLQSTDTDWDVSVTKKKNDAQQLAQEAVESEVDAVAVYGGDGTIMEVAKALVNTDIPVIILPGGTANILAKELQIPLLVEQSVRQLSNKSTKIRTIDMGRVNNTLFMLRMSIGSLADMVIQANPNIKANFGQLAYSISALEKLADAVPASYTVKTPDFEETVDGITMVVANSGNIGLSGFPFVPEIQIDDGYLNLFIIRKIDVGYLTSVLGKALVKRDVADDLYHHKIQKAEITIEPRQNIICDDYQIKSTTLSVETLPEALKIVVPKK